VPCAGPHRKSLRPGRLLCVRRLGPFARFALFTALGAALSACGDEATESDHQVTETDDGLVYASQWSYRSFDVDVDLWLTTQLRDESCITTAALRVNDVISATDTYKLDPTDCTVLMLTEAGDIVLYEQPTGHRWADEALRVDTEAEVISLGPASVIDEAGESQTYRFTLAAPECPDDDDCECGALARFAGDTRQELPLGRVCD
jgi:hypothetical protein